MHFLEGSPIVCTAALGLVLGCSSPNDGTTAGSVTMSDPTVAPMSAASEMPSAAETAVAPSAVATAPPTLPPNGSGAGDGQSLIMGTDMAPVEATGECASSSTGTSLQGVVLAFAFDVSGSMGSYSQPYFAREFKWDPVVAATKAFFADTTSAGVSATLTFFPNDLAPLVGGGGGNQGDACNSVDYEQPDVGLTPLPSDVFGTAIDAITPMADGDWRQGTPTGPALEGTIAAIDAMRATQPNAKYVIVLVTDGEPALCSNQQNDINNVASIAASVADEIPTYVIGIGNPVTDDFPNPPTDGIDNLGIIAQAGGTGQAFLIDTNDPAQTSADFRAVIDSIRENNFNCAVDIPAPPNGLAFDSTKVNVNYQSLAGATELTYDPTCTDPSAWHYDDESNPSVIQLCDSMCTTITNDTSIDGQLDVEFGCMSRVSGAK